MRWDRQARCGLLVGLLMAAGSAHGHDVEEAPPRFLSPADGAIVADLRIPLTVWFPRAWRDREMSLTLDGALVVDPLALVRNRGRHAGGETDYLAVLNLDDLAPGPHTLEATFAVASGDQDTVTSRFEVAPAPGRVDFSIRDGSGALRAGRVLVFDAEGKTVNLRGPDFRNSEGTHRDRRGYAAFAPDGTGAFRVPPGPYSLLFAGGVLDDVVPMQVEIDGPQTIEVTLPRSVERPGWLAADLHVHTGRSADSYLADAFRMESLVCGGVDAVVLSDHNHITEADPAIAQLNLDDQLHTVTGVEARLAQPRPEGSTDKRVSRAHMNMFPVSAAGPQPDQEAATALGFLTSWRERQRAFPHPVVGERLLIQVNHPRGIQVKPKWPVERKFALFDAMGFDPSRPIEDHDVDWLVPPDWDRTAHPLDFDLLEVMNRASPALADEVRQDWFGMMNAGRFPTATGNSDSHTVHSEQAGFPVNLVRVARPAPGEGLDVAAFVDALSAGHVVVTNGPVVDIDVRAGRHRASGGDVLTTRRKRVRVTVSVTAAPWVPVHEVRLIRNGEAIATAALSPEAVSGGVARGEWTWLVAVADGDWLVAEAGWPLADPAGLPSGVYAQIAPGHRPIGFTNPVRLNRGTP